MTDTARGGCLCGSTLFFRGARWPGEIHVTRANFHTPPNREPQAHAYYDTHVDGVELADRLPRLPDPEVQT